MRIGFVANQIPQAALRGREIRQGRRHTTQQVAQPHTIGSHESSSNDFAHCRCVRIARQAPRRQSQLSIVEAAARSEEHTSELQSLMRISYAVFCLKKKN